MPVEMRPFLMTVTVTTCLAHRFKHAESFDQTSMRYGRPWIASIRASIDTVVGVNSYEWGMLTATRITDMYSGGVLKQPRESR